MLKRSGLGIIVKVVATQRFLEFSPRKLGKVNPFWRAYFSNHPLDICVCPVCGFFLFFLMDCLLEAKLILPDPNWEDLMWMGNDGHMFGTPILLKQQTHQEVWLDVQGMSMECWNVNWMMVQFGERPGSHVTCRSSTNNGNIMEPSQHILFGVSDFISHRIHGTGIFAYMNGWFLWSLWVWDLTEASSLPFFLFLRRKWSNGWMFINLFLAVNTMCFLTRSRSMDGASAQVKFPLMLHVGCFLNKIISLEIWWIVMHPYGPYYYNLASTANSILRCWSMAKVPNKSCHTAQRKRCFRGLCMEGHVVQYFLT